MMMFMAVALVLTMFVLLVFAFTMFVLTIFVVFVLLALVFFGHRSWTSFRISDNSIETIYIAFLDGSSY